jgi:peptidoglycan L-alanyl-D-glutamate endopeptidase CwlK
MNSFSQTSRQKLNTCHTDLQRLMEALLDEMDVSILCGYRDEVAQEAAYQAGTSKAHFGESPHNYQPSLAVDVAPYPINFNDIKSFDNMCNKILELAKELGIEVELGRDFQFKDYPHVQIANWRQKT